MPAAQFTVDASDFVALSRAMSKAGEKDLRKRLLKEMGAITKPIVADLRQSVQSVEMVEGSNRGGRNLARAEFSVRRQEVSGQLTERMVDRAVGRSGLRASIARGIRSVVKTGGRSDQVGVRVSTNAAATLPPEHRSLPRLLDKGKWRHPLFGDRELWYAQATTRAGWFERVALTYQPTATRRIHGVLMDFTDELARRIEVGKRIT